MIGLFLLVVVKCYNCHQSTVRIAYLVICGFSSNQWPSYVEQSTSWTAVAWYFLNVGRHQLKTFIWLLV